MAKFNAGSVIEPMSYDFTAYGGGEGIIPEPSTKQVETMFNDIRRLVLTLKEEVKDISGVDITNLENASTDDVPEEAVKALETMGESLMSKQQDALAAILAQVCSDRPNQLELTQLPYRVFAAFQKWLMGEIRPNPQAAVTTS